MDEIRLEKMSPSEKILHLLRASGQMSSSEISRKLNMKKKNVDSIVSRLTKKSKLDRVSAGIYKLRD